MKKSAIVVLVVAALFVLPSLAAAAGIAGANVKIVNPVDATEFGTAQTDAAGAFVFESLPAGDWRLEVATTDLAGQSQLLFAVAPEEAPARCGGLVTSLDGADVSLQVNATIAAMDAPVIVLEEGYPRIQPAWNLNWRHANGRLLVRLAGTGLETLERVSLSSATGTLESAAIVHDVVSGEYAAVFAKKAAFTALVPAAAVRGDVVALSVGLTTALGTETFDAAIRIVGPRRPPRK